MTDNQIKDKQSVKPKATEVPFEFVEMLQDKTDDVVEAFSRGFEQDLRRILGDNYHEPPERSE